MTDATPIKLHHLMEPERAHTAVAHRTDTLHEALITRVIGHSARPQAALQSAISDAPDVDLLAWVFVATSIGAEMRASFTPEPHWDHADWFEAAASLACDVYALNRLGCPNPTGRDLKKLWREDDPHLA